MLLNEGREMWDASGYRCNVADADSENTDALVLRLKLLLSSMLTSELHDVRRMLSIDLSSITFSILDHNWP